MERFLLILWTIFFISCTNHTSTKSFDTFKTDNIPKGKQISTEVSSWRCEQTSLSHQFGISVYSKHYSDTTDLNDSLILHVFIKGTKTTAIDSILISLPGNFGELFPNCDSSMSYSTKFNLNREIVDNYFGDIVVADLNFDNKDDIAILNDIGGNGGPQYNFYTQIDHMKFMLDSYLTDSVSYFPSTIKKSTKTLTTYVHAGACCLGEHVYEYDIQSRKWKQIRHKIIRL